MNEFTLNDLRDILRSSVGVEEGVDLDGPIGTVDFIDLGYDSLALAEVVSQISRRYSVEISDDELIQLTTPDAIISSVNGLLVRTAG